jgi:hypothetical protein
MISRGFASWNDQSERIHLKSAGTPKSLMDIARVHNDEEQALMGILLGLAEVPVGGPNGLKDRTGLSEFRYDVA